MPNENEKDYSIFMDQPDPNPNIETQPAVLYLEHAEFSFKDLAGATAVANFLALACPNPRLAVVGINEILFNAIEHGNLGITYEEKSQLQKERNWIEEIERRLQLPEYKNKCVKVEFIRLPKELHIKVIDEGDGFDWKQFEFGDGKDKLENDKNKFNDNKKEKQHLSHGRGIPIAKNLIFSRLEFAGKGNEVLGVISLS